MKIYTRTGDSGETGLLGGTRVPKDHLRVAAYGEVDETNACLGLALASSDGARLNTLLRQVQADLFALGAELADVRRDPKRDAKSAVSEELVARLEKEIDVREAKLPPLRAFVLPAGRPPPRTCTTRGRSAGEPSARWWRWPARPRWIRWPSST